MKRSITSTAVTRGLATLGASALVIAALAGCTDDTGAAPGQTPAADSDSALGQEVAALQQPLDAYPVPTDPTSDVSDLAGTTVYYIPITQQSPQFAVTGTALTEALALIDVDVQTCNGNATPTDVAACITQATEAEAGAIVTDAIPYGLAANAFDTAQAAGIPVIISNQIPDSRYPASETLNYIATAGATQQVAIAKWIAYDSAGAANVLINQGTDGPSPAAFVAEGQKEYDASCPDCTITINEVSSANFSLIPSSTSAAVLKDPNLSYVVSQFAQYLQPTQTGVQQSGRTDIKGVTGSSQIGALQALAAENFLYAATAQASAFQGWVDADAAIRLMLGDAVPEYTIPLRLFTRDTIGDVNLTEEAEASGEWFGPTTFTDDFATLWGAD